MSTPETQQAGLVEQLREAMDVRVRALDADEGGGMCDANGGHWTEDEVRLHLDSGREILELHTAAGQQPVSSGGWYYCTTCGSGEAYEYPAEWPCQTLILLAKGYGVEVQ